MNNNIAIILAGGSGSRMSSEIPKQFLLLDDKPVIIWSLEAFQKSNLINDIIVVLPDPHIDYFIDIIKPYKHLNKIKIVTGGSTRQESCYNALISQEFHDNDILLIHDAARPFVSQNIITKCISETKDHGAASVYVPAIDTITEIKSGNVTSIPERNNLFYAQTPQSFQYNILKTSHDLYIKNNNTGATDDVALVLNAGYNIKEVEGDYINIKITTDYDYKIAQFIATFSK